MDAMREMLFIEKIYDVLLVRPLRAASSWALVAGIEQRLLDRVVVAGGSGLGRRLVWSGLRRVQNGRLQSYVLLGMLTVLVIVIWFWKDFSKWAVELWDRGKGQTGQNPHELEVE